MDLNQILPVGITLQGLHFVKFLTLRSKVKVIMIKVNIKVTVSQSKCYVGIMSWLAEVEGGYVFIVCLSVCLQH